MSRSPWILAQLVQPVPSLHFVAPSIMKAREGPLIQMQATPPNATTAETMPSQFAPMLPKDTTLANWYAVHKALTVTCPLLTVFCW